MAQQDQHRAEVTVVGDGAIVTTETRPVRAPRPQQGVEVTVAGDVVLVTSRDPNNTSRAVFTHDEWDAFYAEVSDEGYWSHTVTDTARGHLAGPTRDRPPTAH